MNCRHCGATIKLQLLDLGSAPPSNAYLTEQTLNDPELWLPLRVLVCENCWLVQTEHGAEAPALFGADYAYFSGFSSSWLHHCQRYVAAIAARLELSAASYVVEVAANDGSLLQYVQELGIPCMGVEPTASTAAAARSKGLTIVQGFFGVRLARELAAQAQQADLMIANNVLAHVPDLNDFVAGFAILLKPDGVATFEFPHLLRLIEGIQFDTLYHEHLSYLSLTTVERIFSSNGLAVFDMEELTTHGGSLRVFAQRSATGQHGRTSRMKALLSEEARRGMQAVAYYLGFEAATHRIKLDFLSFLLNAKRQGATVAAYGAAAKGNTLLNYTGVRPDLIPFVVDRNPAKQGKYMPGSRIPIVDETCLRQSQPDYVIILPWNLKAEIMQQLDYIRGWDGRFVTVAPQLEVM